jgi:hypothetical protein
MPLADKAATLAEGARQSMQTTGSIHGIVLSSPPTSGMTGQDEMYRLPNGGIALRRALPGERTRETFIIPSGHAADTEWEMWTELYDHEPTWLDWALHGARTQKAE